MKRIAIALLCFGVNVSLLAQSGIENLSSGTSGDAILKIEADTDNSFEGDNSRIELYQDGGSLGAYIGFNLDWGGAGTELDNLFRIGTRYSNSDFYNRLVIRGNDGLVGIGTSNPTSLFHISSLTSGDAILTLEADTDNNNEADNAEIRFIQDGGLVNGFIGFEGDANTRSPGTIANAFILGSEDVGNTRPIQLIVKDEVKMTVTSDKVGIGTTAPSQKFHVSGSGLVRAMVESSDNHAYFVVEGAAGKGSFVDYYRKGDGRIWHTGLRNGNNNFEFRYQNQPSVLTLTGDGNVGIGTNTTGGHKLAVEGTVISREIKVQPTGWSDFVFDSNYQLPSLEKVQEHINKKGHLPDIPSESEVVSNGINLGAMDAKLLQKIEELTLYLIQQNEALKAQQEQNQTQQQLIEQLQQKISNLENK